MTINFSALVRNYRLDAIENAIGPNPVIKLWSGTKPPSCAADDSGIVVASYTLGTDWALGASGASKSMIVTAISASALSTGRIGYYRAYASDAITCHMQGNVGLSSTSDMQTSLIETDIGQNVNILSWIITDGNP
jgi:hypothetical protein